MEPLLRLKNIECYYGPVLAIKGVSLMVNKGDIVTILGANGAGKTTTIRMLSTLISQNFGNNNHRQQNPGE